MIRRNSKPEIAQPHDILDVLAEHDHITLMVAKEVRKAAHEAKISHLRVLLNLGLMSEAALASALSQAASVAQWSPAEIQPDPALLHRVNGPFLLANFALPLAEHDKVLVALADPFHDKAIKALSFAFNKQIEVKVGRAGDIERAWRAFLHEDVSETDADLVRRDTAELLVGQTTSAASIALVDMLHRALDVRASDIHLEPKRRHAQIRYRADGILGAPQDLSLDLAQSVVARAKVLAELDLAEVRLPQDGRMTFMIRGAPLDIRMATLPTSYGESLTLRLLRRPLQQLNLPLLGLSTSSLAVIRDALSRKSGLFLIAGPTGSGKTTTIYAALQELAGVGLKIISIEDPIEVRLDHVVQIQTATGIGLDFATALRSVLRHDPDIVTVGEIRDAETAKIAVQSALTGHLVIASIHARSALGVIPRLIDMGVEPYQIGAAFAGALSQRLIRTLCPECKIPVQQSKEHWGGMFEDAILYQPNGCGACAKTGFTGRMAVSEAFLASDEFCSAVARDGSVENLRTLAERAGLTALRSDVINRIAVGSCSAVDGMACLEV